MKEHTFLPLAMLRCHEWSHFAPTFSGKSKLSTFLHPRSAQREVLKRTPISHSFHCITINTLILLDKFYFH